MRKIFTLLFSLLLLPLMAWGQETINLSQGNQTLESGTYIISGYTGQNRIIIAQNAEVTITLENVTINARNNVSPFDASQAKNVTLLLKGSNSLTATNEAPGLYTPVGGRITIRDAEGDDTVGSLFATGAQYWPGIGIMDGQNTNITIESGAITALGGPGAAGIGGSTGGSGFGNGTVTISGGTVTATGKNGGAGIGGGWGSGTPGPGGTVVISGGIVTATGGYGGAGIGGGTSSFSTGTSGSAIIMASSISDNSKQNDWDGIFFIGNENSGKVYGDVTLQEDWTIKNDQTLEIHEGTTLTVPAGVTLTNNGTISGDGVIQGNIPSGWTGKVAYMLTYDLNGGTGTAPEGGYEIAGETVTLPETTSYTKEGYTCIGWATEKDAIEALKFFTMPKEAKTLYAVWVKNATDVSHAVTGKVGEAFTELDLTTLIDKEFGEYTLMREGDNELPTDFALSEDYKLSAANPLTQAKAEYKVLYTITPKSGAKEATLTLTFNIAKGDATITWDDALGPFTYNGKPVEITPPNVTGALNFSTAATLSYVKTGEGEDTELSEAPKDAGSYKVTASFAGNDNYNAADDVTKEFTIAKAEATLKYEEKAITKKYGDEAFTNVLTNGSNIQVSYESSNTDVATVDASSGKVTILAAGETTITAKDNDLNYAAEAATYTLTVEPTELPEGSEIEISGGQQVVEFDGTSTTMTLTATVTVDDGLGSDGKWTWTSSNTDIATVPEHGDEAVAMLRASDTTENSITATVTIHKTGEATITATYTDSRYTGEVTFNLKVTEKEEEPAPDPKPDPAPTPDPTPLYYNIQFENICEGVDASLSKGVVKEGNQVSVYVEVEEGYDGENLKVLFKRSLYGYWEEVKEGVQPGEYIIYNVYHDIYVKVEGVEKIEEEPTGMSDIEGTKVYTQNGNLYIYTSQPQEVAIITMNGTILKRERQEGLRSYFLPRGIYIICIGEEKFKLRI